MSRATRLLPLLGRAGARARDRRRPGRPERLEHQWPERPRRALASGARPDPQRDRLRGRLERVRLGLDAARRSGRSTPARPGRSSPTGSSTSRSTRWRSTRPTARRIYVGGYNPVAHSLALYKSTNSGVNWTLLAWPFSGGDLDRPVLAVTVDPTEQPQPLRRQQQRRPQVDQRRRQLDDVGRPAGRGGADDRRRPDQRQQRLRGRRRRGVQVDERRRRLDGRERRAAERRRRDDRRG